MRRRRVVIWAVALAVAGAFLGTKAESNWGILIGAALGGSIGFGFGCIFGTENPKRALVYWVITIAGIGSLLGLEEPVVVTRLLRRTAYGAAIGAILGVINHLVEARTRRPERNRGAG